jgi:tetratricopeptide (TPR) repeat protein
MRRRFIPRVVNLGILLTLLTTRPVLADRTAAVRNNGFQLYASGHYREAIAELDRVIQKHPRDIEALIKRGNCYLRLDQPALALTDFDRVTRHGPFFPAALTDRGIALLMLGRNNDALESFHQAIGAWKTAPLMDPASIIDGLLPVPNLAGSLRGEKSQQIVQGYATAQSGLGQVYHRLGQNQQAVTEYDRAIEIYALDPNAYIGRGDCRAALGDHEQALADYNEAIRLEPNHSRAYSSRGKLLEAMGQDARAEADYDRAIQLDPGFTYALRLRAALLSRHGRNGRAVADVDAATRLRPDDAGGYKDRGGVLVRLGQYQQAIDTLNRAIELDPSRASAYLNRGAAYNGLRQYERAIEDLNKALALDPRNAGAHTNIGLAYYMIGQYERAMEDLSEAVRLTPENAIVHLNRGNVYARLGFKEQAVADYESATRLDPGLIAYYGGSAKLLEEMGRNNLAIRDEKRLALRNDPAELDLHLEQGNLLRSRGDWKGAIGEYDQVIAQQPNRAEVYVARGWTRLCAGETGAQADARSFLDIKGWRDRISPYMALLSFFGSREADKENDARTILDEAISSSPEATWPVPVLRFLRHEISAEALLKAAGSEAQKTEAHTFVGLELLHRGDLKQAREHLNWVRQRGAPNSIATDLAKATLERIDHPQEALSRMIDDMLNR